MNITRLCWAIGTAVAILGAVVVRCTAWHWLPGPPVVLTIAGATLSLLGLFVIAIGVRHRLNRL